MLTAAEISLWGPGEALQALKGQVPLGWTLTRRVEGRYWVAELQDADGNQVWNGSNLDPKFLYLEGLGWLLTRSHKPRHPAWRPREQEHPLRVPNAGHDPVPADLDPAEVRAVYKNRR